MRVLLFVVFLSVLTGCGQTVYMKDGATVQQFQRDDFECRQQVITMYGGLANMGPGHAIMARQDIHECMAARGYRQATADEAKQAKAAKGTHAAP